MSESSGRALLRDSVANKWRGFSTSERQHAALTGLVPAGPALTVDQQVELVMENLARQGDDLCRYEVLARLAEFDLHLFYQTVLRHTAKIMPLVYTPTVGAACTNYSRLLLPHRGLFISIEDAGRVADVLAHAGADGVRAIVVTDGERILGLGDLGANGMGIPVGKLSLYTALAGVDPLHTLPITLDVGTNNADLLADPYYIGLRKKRVTGEEYHAFIEEFVQAVQQRYGSKCLIQWEDFGNGNAFDILHKYQSRVVSFNDDIQGTASVVLAGLLSAPKINGIPLEKATYLFYGAGEAGVGIADLVAYAISLRTGSTIDQARANIWLVDSKGLVTSARLKSGATLEHHKMPYAHDYHEGLGKGLEEIIRDLRPSALVGVSAQGGAFTEGVVKAMCDVVDRPIVFALSNPTSKAECTAEQAYVWSEGKAIFASGSPFDPVTVTLKDGSQTFVPGQANNSWIFPAVGLAVLAVEITEVTDHTMFVAATALADQVTAADLETGCLFPPLERIRTISAHIATAIAEDAYAKGKAALHRPADLAAHVSASMWSPRSD